MLAELKSKGFDMITVNGGDDARTIGKFWKEQGFTMPAAMHGDKVATLYHVSAIPTNYVIGSDGKILARFLGFDEEGIRKALAQAGVK
jgi:hypothetical protein